MAHTVKAGTDASAGAMATGRPNQGHLCYAPNQGAYWAMFPSDTNTLSFLYSTDSGVTWTAPTGSPYTLADNHGSEGRALGFACQAIGANDVLHLCNTTNTVHVRDYRWNLGTALTNASGATSGTGRVPSVGYPAAGFGVDHSCFVLFDSTPDSNYTYRALWDADTGTSFPGTISDSGMTPGGSTTSSGAHAVCSLGATHDYLLIFAPISAGTMTSLSAASYIASMNADYASFITGLTATDPNNWGAVGRTTSDIHVVALSNNNNTYVHYRFNGTSFSAGDSVPTLSMGANGLSLVSNGTNVWAAAFDTSKNLKYTKWTSGSGWGAWTTLEAARTNTPSYLTGVYNGSNEIMWAWTELNGSNYDIISTTLATVTAPTTATLSGPTAGTTGVASANFTITLDHAVISGTVSCPITSSVGGDTITTSPVVITVGNSTGTFTITPSTSAARTITLGTTTPSLTIAGSPITYTATALNRGGAGLMMGM